MGRSFYKTFEIHNPSEDTGVGAWELQARLTGPGAIMGWEFEGDYVNVGSYNELIVGIGGTPLVPDASGAVLLATVRILVVEPFPTEVTLQLGPIYHATIPGLMAWIPWHDAELVIPMLPSSGIETVSWINYNALPAQDIPAPQANLLDLTVTLQWPRPADVGDGGDGESGEGGAPPPPAPGVATGGEKPGEGRTGPLAPPPAALGKRLPCLPATGPLRHARHRLRVDYDRSSQVERKSLLRKALACGPGIDESLT